MRRSVFAWRHMRVLLKDREISPLERACANDAFSMSDQPKTRSCASLLCLLSDEVLLAVPPVRSF
jgi:hypothetical protein